MSEHKISGCSAVGSALDWGSRGREFKSRHSDQVALTKKMQAKIPHFGVGFLRKDSEFSHKAGTI
mgnify:CR=1 FL=1